MSSLNFVLHVIRLSLIVIFRNISLKLIMQQFASLTWQENIMFLNRHVMLFDLSEVH